MSDVITEFFDELGRRGHERLYPKTDGTLLFDLTHEHGTDHWFVMIMNGAVVQVTREKREADCIIRTDRAFFERLIRGEAKPLTAWLRNDITTEGRFRYIVLLERLFAPPPDAHHPRVMADGHGGSDEDGRRARGQR